MRNQAEEDDVPSPSTPLPDPVPSEEVVNLTAAENETLTLAREELQSIVDTDDGMSHPLIKIQALAELDKLNPSDTKVVDHGSWDGRWPLPSRSEWQSKEALQSMWPTSSNEVYAAQTARKEYRSKRPTSRHSGKLPRKDGRFGQTMKQSRC